MTITVAQGELKWGYRPVATLRPCLVTKSEDGQWTLTATIESSNFMVSQRPLEFVTPNYWRWPITSLQIEGASLTATLGPREQQHGPTSPTS